MDKKYLELRPKNPKRRGYDWMPNEKTLLSILDDAEGHQLPIAIKFYKKPVIEKVDYLELLRKLENSDKASSLFGKYFEYSDENKEILLVEMPSLQHEQITEHIDNFIYNGTLFTYDIMCILIVLT